MPVQMKRCEECSAPNTPFAKVCSHCGAYGKFEQIEGHSPPRNKADRERLAYLQAVSSAPIAPSPVLVASNRLETVATYRRVFRALSIDSKLADYDRQRFVDMDTLTAQAILALAEALK